jgi:outer membrane protein
MKISLLTSIVVLLFVSFSSSAQDEKKEWTLQECISTALENNLGIRRSIYSVENTRISMTQAKMAFLPTVSGFGSYGQNYGRAVNPVTNQFINRNSNTLSISGNSSVTLFNGLRLQNTFRQTNRDYEASNYDLSKAKNDVIINVVTIYTNVIFNKELFNNATYQLNSSVQQLERIKKQVAAGALAKSNELNQEATVATNEVTLINQENALNISLLQLKQALQLPASTALDVQIPDIALEALILDQDPGSIFTIAKENMPEIKSALLKVESAQLALSASKGNLYPRLSLNASAQSNYSSISNSARTRVVGYALGSTPIGEVGNTGTPVYTYEPVTEVVSENYNQKDQLKDNLFKSLSLQLSIPIFNGLQNRTAVQRAAINSELALISKKEIENTLRQAIETAFNDAYSASKTYAASQKQVQAREEAYRMNQQRFEAGALSIVEFQISENDLFQSKTELTRAKYNFIFKKKVLDFYQGKKIEF